MPLPQQVINQLASEPAQTPGWSSGVIFFCAGLLIVVLAIYFGMTLGYEPYLNSQIASTQSQVATLSQSIPSQDQAGLIAFYSQISNLKTLLKQHILFSQFLSWLEQNTEANVYYASFSFASGNQITFTGNAKTEADINEQAAIFQSSPQVEKFSLSNVGVSSAGGGGFQFSGTLLMNPSVFIEQITTSSQP